MNRVSEILEAIERDDLVGLKKLVQKGGADLNSEVPIGEEYGLEETEEIPFLFCAVKRGATPEALRVLMEAGMDLHRCTEEGVGIVDIAVKYRRRDLLALCREEGIDLSGSRRKSGMTPLMLAAAFDDVETIRYLLEAGVETDAADGFGMTALDYARKMGQKRAQALLESEGARYALYRG